MRPPIYFGCVGGLGHRLVFPNGMSAGHGRGTRWMERLDGVLPPQQETLPYIAAVHRIHCYTVLSFWDHTVDSRPGAHSTFFIPERIDDFDALLLACEFYFPQVFARFRGITITQYTA